MNTTPVVHNIGPQLQPHAHQNSYQPKFSNYRYAVQKFQQLSQRQRNAGGLYSGSTYNQQPVDNSPFHQHVPLNLQQNGGYGQPLYKAPVQSYVAEPQNRVPANNRQIDLNNGGNFFTMPTMLRPGANTQNQSIYQSQLPQLQNTKPLTLNQNQQFSPAQNGQNLQSMQTVSPQTQLADDDDNKSDNNNLTQKNQQFVGWAQQKNAQDKKKTDIFGLTTFIEQKNNIVSQKSGKFKDWSAFQKTLHRNIPPKSQTQKLKDYIQTHALFLNSMKSGQKLHLFSPFIRYKIIPYMDQKKVLDIASVNSNKKKLKKNEGIIWDYHGGPNQHFHIKEQQSGLYTIINLARGFALTYGPPVAASSSALSMKDLPSQLIVYPVPKENRDWYLQQLWKINKMGPNQKYPGYEIQCAKTGKVLDLFERKQTNGTKVVLWDRTGYKNQRWFIVPV